MSAVSAPSAPISRDDLRTFQLVVQHVPNMVVIADAERRIEWVNDAYTSITGWTLDEVRGRRPAAFLHGPGTDPEVVARVREALERGEPVAGVEVLNYTKDGRELWIALNIQPVCDADGRVHHYVAIQSNLTERKRFEQALSEQRQLLQQALALAHMGSWEMDHETGAMVCSDEMYRLFGRSCTDSACHWECFLERVHPQDLPRVREAFAQPTPQRPEHEFEHRIVLPGGQVRWLLQRGRTEFDPEGRPVRTSGFAQDITESKRNEKLERDKQALEQLSRAKTQFLSYMSHELRTPLNAIVGFSQLLQSRADALPPTVARYPDLILQASEHLLRLINDLLDLSLVESGGLALSRDRVDVPKLLHELIVLLDPIARKRDVEVRMEPGARMHCSVWGDSTRLRQSFINLLSNGIKYNRHGGTLTVRVLPGEGQVRIEFEDQGDGIPADKLDSLFEPLQRLGRESGDVEGAGLGLALTRSLIERMGGRIGVRSQVGRGSVFVVEMPRAEEDDGPVSRPAPWIEPEALAAPRPYGRVLCIEDNEFNCLLLEGLFEQRPGLAVSYARTGAEGLLLAQQSPPDLILLDMRLPDMDGHQVYAQLQQDARTRGVPVIACSASAYAEDIRQALSEGLAGYLIKPLSMPQFLATIDRFLPPPVEGR